jgi:hypothetical protein
LFKEFYKIIIVDKLFLNSRHKNFFDINSSMGDNQCLSMDPDGICYGDAEKTDQTVATIDQVKLAGSFFIHLKKASALNLNY